MRNFIPKNSYLLTVISAVAILFSFLFINTAVVAQDIDERVFTTVGSGTFTVPEGVTKITVEAIGGGGGGGSRSSNGRAGGGGGGAYAKSTLSVTPGTAYDYTVGGGGGSNTAGGNSRFYIGATDLVRAAGGSGGSNNITNGAAGGTVAHSVGDVKHYGGNGGNGGSSYSGGGGGGAGTSGNGKNANNNSGGLATSEFGGAGGNGHNNNANGNLGNDYGGGGSGGRRSGIFSATRNGGSGAQGAIRITYTKPTFEAEIKSVNIGSNLWEIDEIRTVTVTVENIGYGLWGNSLKTEVGVKWSSESNYTMLDGGNLMPGTTDTYAFPIPAGSDIKTDKLTFRVQ